MKSFNINERLVENLKAASSGIQTVSITYSEYEAIKNSIQKIEAEDSTKELPKYYLGLRDPDTREVIEFKRWSSTSFDIAFVLQWLYPHSIIRITDADLDKLVQDLPILNKHGIFVDDQTGITESAIDNIEFYLNLKGQDMDLFLRNQDALDAINWAGYKRFYCEATADQYSEIRFFFLKKKYNWISIITNTKFVELTTLVKELSESKQVPNLYEIDFIKTFLTMKALEVNTQTLVNVLSQLVSRYEAVNRNEIYWLPATCTYQYQLLSFNLLPTVLAIFHIATGAYICIEDSIDLNTRFTDAIKTLTSRPWSTAAERLKTFRFIENYTTLTVPDEETGELEVFETSPVAVMSYLNISWIGVIKSINNNIKLQYISWREILSILEYNDTKDYVMGAVSSDNIEYCRLPVFKSKLSKTDETKRTYDIDYDEVFKKFDILDLNQISGEYAILNGTDTHWNSKSYPKTASAITHEEIKYAFWEEICRLMEQLVILPDKESGKMRPYTRYITLRDLVFLKDKETGEIFLGFVNFDYTYDTLLLNKNFIVEETLTEIDYVSLDSYFDTVDYRRGATVKDSEIKRLKLIETVEENVEQIDPEFYQTFNPRPLPYDRDLYKITGEVSQSKEIIRALTYAYCKANYRTAEEDTTGLDVFETEMVDPLNIEIYKILPELAEIVTPYGARLVQSAVNIFGGLNSYHTNDYQRYKFDNFNKRKNSLSVKISSNHLVRY